MRSRNLVKNRFDFSYLFFYLTLVFYQVLSSVYYWIPPLFGVFFCYMIVLLKEKERTLNKLDFRWYFSLFYLLLIDVIHGFYLFSSWIAFFIFYHFFVDWFKSKLKLGRYLLVIFTFCAYIFIYLFDVFLAYLDNNEVLKFGIEYLWFFTVEALISFVIFKGKI
ncbi:putative membrane protein [Campylobacter lari]